MRPAKGFDVLVLGGGISGLTAAYHAALQGLRVGLIEAALPGGLVVNVGRIDGYPSVGPVSGVELASALHAELGELGVTFLPDTVTKLGIERSGPSVTTSAGARSAKAVVCAFGATLTKLDVPGAAELSDRGVSQCAFCDAGLYRDAPVVVIGGGDAALQEALHLTDYASEVVLVHRGSRLRARKHYVTRAADSPKMQFRWSSEVVEVLGTDAVQGVRIRHRERGDEETLACRAVFPFLGLSANSDLLAALAEIDLDARVVVDANLMTRTEGVYAVGALRSGFGGQITNAVSDGSCVAHTIAQRL